MGDMKSASQRAIDEMDKQAKAESMPMVKDHGMEVGGTVMREAKLKEMESRMDTPERKQYHAVRTTRYGYPPVK